MKKPLDEPRLDAAAATGNKPVQPSQGVVVNTLEYEGSAEKKKITMPPPTLTSQFTVVANRYYFKERPDQEAFVDHGDRLRTRHDSPLAVLGMLTLAESQGWDTIKVSGSEAFRQTVWLEGSLLGLTVNGYQPTAQDRTALTARQQEQATAPLSAAATLHPTADQTQAPNQAQTGPAQTTHQAQAPSPPPAAAAPATSAAGYATRREPFAATTAHAAQQRESRQAAIRGQVMLADRQAHQEQQAQAQAEQRRQAQQQEKAAQLRAAVDTLDKRSALKSHPELARFYPLLAEAENFARAHLRPENQAEFVAQIKERSLQELARGDTLPKLPPVAEKAARQDRSQARRREPAAEVEL